MYAAYSIFQNFQRPPSAISWLVPILAKKAFYAKYSAYEIFPEATNFIMITQIPTAENCLFHSLNAWSIVKNWINSFPRQGGFGFVGFMAVAFYYIVVASIYLICIYVINFCG